MNNNRPSRSFRQYEEYDEDFSNVYSNTAYRSSGDGREGPYESNQRWAATDSISSSRTPGVRKSVTEASTRASTQRAAANINSASRNSASASKSKTGTNSSSTTSKVYRDTNIWGLLEKSYRTQDDPTSSNIPKLYFDGTPSDPYNYQEAVEITSSSGGSRHTSYLKQLEDYLLEKDMDIEEQMNKDKSDRMRGRSSLSSSSSKPIAGRGSVTSTRPQTGSKRPTVNSSSSFEFDGNHLNTIREIPRKSNANLEKIGEMTLEELAQLPLDLSDNSHLDIIDSEINAFYQSGYDQPKRSMGSSTRKSTAAPPKTSTKARAIVEPSISLPSRRPPEPPKPKVAPKAKFEPKKESEPEDESESYVEPPQPPPDRNPELSQAKSSLSLLKSKIKQVNNVTSRVIRKNDSNVEASYPVGEPTTRNSEAETALDEEEEDDDVFSSNNTQIRSTNTEGTNRPVARIPMPTGSKYVQPTSSKTPTRTYPLPEEDEHEDDATLQNHRKPQSLQDMLKQKNQVSPPPFSASKNANIRPPYQSEEDDDYPSKQINRQSDPRKKEVTSSYSSNPYEQDEFEDEEGEDVEQPTEECPDCGRKFIPTAFQKHVKICQKVFMQKRKKFDMTKQRLVGEGVDPELKKVYEKAKKEEMKAKRSGGAGGQGKNDSVQDSKWKQQSSAFRDAMRAAREYAKAKERGEEPPPPAISAPDPSLIPCPNCGRRFNEMAANRHIPQCKNIKAKPTALKRGGGINASAGLPAKSRTGRF